VEEIEEKVLKNRGTITEVTTVVITVEQQ